jgi:tetratricopeptide (TPR) repeat protein
LAYGSSTSFASSWPLAALAALAAGCGGAGPGPRKQPAVAAYAEPKVCASCHAGIARSYQLTAMGRSIGPAPRDKPGVFAHRASGATYTVLEREGEVYQRRQRDTHVAERRADFAIGSGNHAQSFLSRNREGKFVELPLTLYAAKGGYWEMSPGYDRPDQEDFRRVVPDECLFCHASYAQPLQAIDCQRCHGPGRAHAESSGREPIVNPKKLSRERQVEVCMQCHLETTSSPLPNSIRRFERDVFSYRPGEPLADFILHFDHAPGSGHDDKFEIAGAAYRLRKSACFQKSQMTCSTCHDPHSVRRGAEAAGCKQCHASAHNPGTSCIECHMPKRRTDDAVHVTMTDHFIQRRAVVDRPRPEQKPYRGEVSLYYPERLPATPEGEAYLATAQVQHGANLAAGIPRLEAAIAKLAPSGPEFYFELAKAYAKKGDEETAVRWFDEALRRKSDFRLAVKGLAASLLALRRFERVAELLAAAKDPDARMLTNQGQALLELGRVDEAAQVLNRAVAANSDLPEPHDLLGLVRLRQGDAKQAGKKFGDALAVHPGLASAHANLASLFAGRKEFVQSQQHFLKALAFDPGAAETHRNYAFLLILMRNYDRARSEFDAAARLAPSRPQARLDLAELEQAAGRPDAAAGQYRLALQQSPDFAEAHYGLGVLLLQSGSAAEARTHLAQAANGSGDPAIRQLAAKALAALP